MIENLYDVLARISTKNYYDETGALQKTEAYTYDAGDADHDVQFGELYKIEELSADGTLLRSTLYGYDAEYRRQDTVTKNMGIIYLTPLK